MVINISKIADVVITIYWRWQFQICAVAYLSFDFDYSRREANFWFILVARSLTSAYHVQPATTSYEIQLRKKSLTAAEIDVEPPKLWKFYQICTKFRKLNAWHGRIPWTILKQFSEIAKNCTKDQLLKFGEIRSGVSRVMGHNKSREPSYPQIFTTCCRFCSGMALVTVCK